MTESKNWRLLPLLRASGAVQMAIDSWLFDQHHQHGHPPTLRFYTWSPVAVSLGYHQRTYPSSWHQLTWQGQPVEVVRRPSGGRAVLHQGDLTYAVITSPLTDNRMQAYRNICEFLIAGWRSLHLPLHYGTAGRGYIHNPNCFGTATTADLVLANGAKFIGSAQLRRGKTVLQHGSMRLQLDAGLFEQVFGVVPDAIALPPPLTGSMTADTMLDTVVEALISAASQCFAANFVLQPFTPEEWEAIGTGSHWVERCRTLSDSTSRG